MQLESTGKLKTIYKELSEVGNFLSLSPESSGFLEKSFKDLSAFELADKLSDSGLNNELKQQIAHNLDLSLSTELLSKTQSKSAAATTKLGTAFKGLAADTLSATGEIITFLATTPAGLALVAVAATTTIITTINKIKEEVAEQIRECTSDYREVTSELTSYQALSDYQAFVDEKFSDTDALIAELLTTTDENQSTTNRVLAELAKAAGYKLSEDLLKRIRTYNEKIYQVTPDLPLVYGNVTGAAAPVQSYSREYELALQNLLQTTARPSLPAQSVTSGGVSIRIDQMNLPNVTRPEEFSRNLITALQNDSGVVKSIQAVSTDLIAGKSIHRVRRF